MLAALIGTLGAGLGLTVGLAFNVRLAAHARHAVLATLVNFAVGLLLTGALTALGVGGQSTLPLGVPLWALLGGAVGAAYVSATLFTARSLGIAASTAGVTLGQILAARLIDAFGLLGQPTRPVAVPDALGATLLLVAVVLLARERASSKANP